MVDEVVNSYERNSLNRRSFQLPVALIGPGSRRVEVPSRCAELLKYASAYCEQAAGGLSCSAPYSPFRLFREHIPAVGARSKANLREQAAPPLPSAGLEISLVERLRAPDRCGDLAEEREGPLDE
ncbi:hypothetical protein CYMTET_32904 [Cymbomonas tetramitiformis]|uniref:Uncharacterized protein n=1 Tax=Cymbomonas tetramitiformis TaxID=36881 RepID=A0AAE0FE55_9CHLO|nr:hypothetical protein CYMTET_32904 [Cymbomonas tetramitiformis]